MSEQETQKIVSGVLAGLLDSGHVLVTAELADAALQHKKAIDRLMRKSACTAYEVAKFKLIGTNSIRTIKAMVADGRINKLNETFISSEGKLCITNACLKRLRNE